MPAARLVGHRFERLAVARVRLGGVCAVRWLEHGRHSGYLCKDWPRLGLVGIVWKSEPCSAFRFRGARAHRGVEGGLVSPTKMTTCGGLLLLARAVDV